MPSHFPKIKFYLFNLFLGLFLFPLLSSAQFITTNAPCEPEIIPPYGQVEGVFCPYCPNKGEYVHLKWDLKANFQDPVCSLNCWDLQGLQCNYWPEGRLFSGVNRSKFNIKPKDDVFVKRPATGPRNGDGVNYQVSCWEKGDLSRKTEKRSSGIRVVNSCEENLTAERRFSDIINDLNSYKPTLITETSLSRWSWPDVLDYTKTGSGNGSGDRQDIESDIVIRQDGDMSDMTNYLNDYENLHLGLLKKMKINSQNKDASPLGMVFISQLPPPDHPKFDEYMDTTFSDIEIADLRASGVLDEKDGWNIWGVTRGLHAVVFLGIKSHDKDYSNFQMEILDPNFINGSGLKVIPCQKRSLQFRFGDESDPLWVRLLRTLYPDIYIDPLYKQAEFSDFIYKTPGIFRNYYLCQYEVPLEDEPRVFIPFDMDVYTRGGIDLSLAKKNAVRRKTADYLRIADNQLSFENFAGGVCAGWTDFTLRVAYLGNFTGIDYHPDGTVSKLFDNSHFLSAISLFSKDLTTKLFKLDK